MPRLRDADDVGRFIAGLPETAGSPFASLESSEAWKEHRRRLDDTWRKAETPLISGLREFQKEELNEGGLRNSPVFYPFGGPDALTAILCFPQSPVYVMVGLEPAGTLPGPSRIERKDRAVDYKAPGRFGNKGIEIEFRADSDQSVHKLYYFSVNLSDERLKENQPFLAYLSSLKGTTTLLKATSYMTHRPDFSLIRDQILANSTAILQDDSGIPYRYFEPELWKVQLYGVYRRPYGSFHWLEQPDLRGAYKVAGAKPLSLHLGYGFSRIVSNLLVARRVYPLSATSTPEVPPQGKICRI